MVLLVCIFSGSYLVQVTGTDASCFLCIICFQFMTFEQDTLYCAYCVWFIALLASTYAALFQKYLNLFFAEFDSSVYISIQFELH